MECIFAKVRLNFSLELQLLYRHLAEGELDVLQPGKQYAAARAQSVPHSGQGGDNSHVVAGAMSVEEWERRRGHESDDRRSLQSS